MPQRDSPSYDLVVATLACAAEEQNTEDPYRYPDQAYWIAEEYCTGDKDHKISSVIDWLWLWSWYDRSRAVARMYCP